MEPLTDSGPLDHKAAKAETPAAEAAAWLANPEAPRDTLTPNMRYIQRLEQQPEFQGPWPSVRDTDPEEDTRE